MAGHLGTFPEAVLIITLFLSKYLSVYVHDGDYGQWIMEINSNRVINIENGYWRL